MRRQAITVPPRHAAVMRPPSKEVKVNDTWSQSHSQGHREALTQPLQAGRPSLHASLPPPPPLPSPPRAIAYVSDPPRCEHSIDLLRLARELGVKLEIYNIDEIGHPEWLPGTPSIETSTLQVYCGDAAFEWVMSAAQSQRDRAPEVARAAAAAAPTAPAAPSPYDFLAQAAPEAEPPKLGASLNSVFHESDRLGQMADRAAAQPEQNAQAAFEALMNARD